MKLTALDVMTEAFTKPYVRGLERMALSFGTTAANGTTSINAYDFQSYQTLYGRVPDAPIYLVVPRFSPSADLDVTFQFNQGSSVTIGLPAKTKPGLAIAIPLPPLVDPHLSSNPTLRLTQFQPAPDPPAGQPADNWSIFVAIGNIAKLLWVLSGEMDLLSWHLDDVSAQRRRLTAHSLSLDYLGEDLGVPRFPPTAYSWDAATIALYHLEDVPPVSGTFTVKDARDIHASGTGHSGTAHNVLAGLAGRFRQAFRFTSGGSYVSVIGSAASGGDLATVGDLASDLTIEAFIHADPPASQPGCVIAKKAQLTGNGAGWAITVGNFRSLAGNIRFSVADGAQSFELFSDLSVADGRYHHVAGIVQRRTGFSLLHLLVDGREVMRLPAPGLGSVTNGQDMQIGLGTEAAAGDAQYLGLIDEVRVSRIARETFDPVLNGEGDQAYRQRLGIFERWTLPTPTAIETAVNELVQVGTPPDPSSFEVHEEQNPLVVGSRLLRVLPNELKPEQSIAADGRLGAAEAEVVGMAGDTDFDPAWLVTYSDARISDGGHSTWSSMQVSVRDALFALVSSVGGPMSILAGYEPRGTGLYEEGRALLLTHGTVKSGALAAASHVAGFDYVRRERTGETYVAQARHEVFRIGTASSAAPLLTDVGEGKTLALTLSPEPPRDCEVHWSLTRCGPGAAHFAGPDPHNAAGDPNKKGGQTLFADAAGDIALQVEVTRSQSDGAVCTGRGSRMLRIGINDTAIALGHSISRDGARDQSEAVASPSASFFDETYMVTRNEDLTSSAVLTDYGADPLHRRMQRATSERLIRLLLKVPRVPKGLKVLRAFDPGAAGSGHVQGRALLLRHTSLSPSALAARAFSVGFDFVAVQGAVGSEAVYVSVAPAELLAVSAPARAIVVDDDVHPLEITVEPQARPSSGCFLPDGGRAYLTDIGSHRVTELTVVGGLNTFPTFRVTRSAWVGIEPTSVCATASNVFVANRLSNTICVLDPTTVVTTPLSVASTIPTDPSPVFVVTDGAAFFVACRGSASGQATVKRYALGSNSSGFSWSLPTGRQPLALVISGGQLFVTHAPTGASGAGAFDVLTAANLTHVTSVATGAGPVSAVTRNNHLFVACRDASTVQVYDISNVLSIPAPVVLALPQSLKPLSLAVSGDVTQRYVYVAAGPATPTAGAGMVHIIDLTGLSPGWFTESISTGADPSFVIATPSGAAAQPPFYNPAVAIVSQEADNIAIADQQPLAGLKAPEVVDAVPLGTGAGERLQWTVDSLGSGRANLSSTTRPRVSIRTEGRQTGWISVRAIMTRTDKLNPYSFELRLKPSLEVAATRLEKNQYDIVMNVLNSFHPIGVEVKTERLRQYVAELGEGLSDLLPGYSFPVFRTPRLPQQSPGDTEGVE